MQTGRIPQLLMILVLGGACGGCLETKKALHYFGDHDLEHYKHEATEIEFPDVHEPTPDEVTYTGKPRTINDRQHDETWKVSLAEVVQLALANNRIIRSSPFLSRGSALFSNPDRNPSAYDPSIQETGVLFGGRGIEAALAEFDTQFTTTMLWGRNETVQNNRFFSGGLNPGNTLVGETGTFRAELRKRFAYGATFRIGHDWDYLGTNSPGTLFPSSYRGNIRAEYRHALWAGQGAEFSRIAGPLNSNFGAITGVSQGVVIARINNDITLADFEASVRNLLKDTEDLYWDLYLAYRAYDTAVAARNSAFRSWRDAKTAINVGGGDYVAEAQSRDQFYQAQAAVERTLAGCDSRSDNSIYALEAKLRRLLGLQVNDGRIIQPTDEPLRADFTPDWHACLTEALTHRVELRRQKWNIKSLELQLQAAQSLTNPRLDFVSAYRVNGFGDRLLGQNDDDGSTRQGLHSAYETITQGNQTGWNLGLEFSMPIGFRSAQAQVRNYELRLAKARDILATQEMEISHEVAHAIQCLTSQYAIAQTNFYRRRAARDRLRVNEAKYEVGQGTLDEVLRAQASVADAEIAFFTAMVEYSKALADLHFRKGTLLSYNNVQLAESEWTSTAYKQSLRRAWALSHAFDTKLLHTEPAEFALPGYQPQVELHLGEHHEWSGRHGDEPAYLVPSPDGGSMKDDSGGPAVDETPASPDSPLESVDGTLGLKSGTFSPTWMPEESARAGEPGRLFDAPIDSSGIK